jgi:hypothetical protein
MDDGTPQMQQMQRSIRVTRETSNHAMQRTATRYAMTFSND